MRELARDDVRVVATQQLTPELSDMASRAELVLFIDAARSGRPGTLKCEQIVAAAPASRHSHELSPACILKLAQELYGRRPTAYTLTVAGESFATGDTVSATVGAALPALKARIRQFIDGSAGKKIE